MSTRDVAVPTAGHPRGPMLSSGAAHGVVAALVASLLLAFALTTGFTRDLVTVVATAAPALTVAAVLAAGRLPDRRPWVFVLAGLVVLNLYNTVWMVEHYGTALPPPASLLTSFGLPLGYLVILGGAVDLVYRPSRRDGGAVLDATIIALSASLLVWVLVLGPRLDPAAVSGTSRVVTMAVLVLISAIGGALVRAAVFLRSRRVSMGYLLGTIVTTLVGTVCRELTTTPAAPDGAPWVSVTWIIAYGTVVGAVLHPSAATVAVGPTRPGRLTRGRLLALGAALLIGPALMGVDEVRGSGSDPLMIVGINLVLVLLVVVRLSRLARSHADAEEALARLATQDELTGLPNRRAIDTEVQRVLRRVQVGEAPGAVVAFLDLDDFKEVNDTHGHQVGDQLLVVVAERLRAALRPQDVVGRFGGDEFVIVLEGDPKRLEGKLVPRVTQALRAPVRLPGHTVEARASVGTVPLHAGDPRTAEVVLSTADARMYERKRRRSTGRGGD